MVSSTTAQNGSSKPSHLNGHDTHHHDTNGAPAKKKPRLEEGLHVAHSVCLVLDYGSQYTQLIARRVRELGVYSMLLPGDVTLVRNTKLDNQ